MTTTTKTTGWMRLEADRIYCRLRNRTRPAGAKPYCIEQVRDECDRATAGGLVSTQLDILTGMVMARFPGKPGDVDGEPGALQIRIRESYPGHWMARLREYDLGTIQGSGLSADEAAADFCEQYADSEVVAKLAEAWEAINALGGTDGGSYNDAIGQALAIVERLGAPQGRRK